MSGVGEIAIGVPDERRGFRVALVIFGLVFLIGAAAFAYALATDPGSMSWGFVVANFIFLLGVSQFGVAFAAIMRICGAYWPRPYYRLGEVATLAFMPLGLILLVCIYVFGKEALFYWLAASPDAHLSPWLEPRFLLLRNLVAQVVFYAIAIVYFLNGLLPDITRESSEQGPGWLRFLYRWLWSRRQGKTAADIEDRLYRLSPVLLIACVLANTFIAWDFAMMLFPHYHSTVFPMYFILGNMLAGSAVLLLLKILLSRAVDVDEYFGVDQLRSMGILLTAFVLLWLYFFWAQFFVTWFGNMPHEFMPIWKRMYGHYGPFFWVMMACNIGIPLALLIFAGIKRMLWSMALIALVMNIGIWLNRYLLVVPALVDDHVPFGSSLEVVLVAGLFAGFLLVLLALFNAFPMISVWEVRRDAETEGGEGP